MGKKKKLTIEEIIAAYTLMDDEFMSAVLDGNIPAVALVLRIIMGMPDIQVTECKGQYVLDGADVGKRGVRLDIRAVDGAGKAYDIEVQRRDTGDIPQRTRFNGAAMDVRLLDEGQDFDKLAESYVIFIMEKDPYGTGLPKYTVNRHVEELGWRAYGDGSHIILVNGEYRGDDSIGKLMHDFSCKDGDDMIFPELRDGTNQAKGKKGGEKNMSDILKEYRQQCVDEGKEEGREEGKEEGVNEMIVFMWEDGDSPERIARVARKGVSEVKTIIAASKKAATL